MEPEYTTPYDINIIGEYNLAGELWQVKPLLDELGIRILSCISGDGKYHEVAWSHRARAAMMVCSKAMINVARKMEERYGIPFFEGSFYGIGTRAIRCARSPAFWSNEAPRRADGPHRSRDRPRGSAGLDSASNPIKPRLAGKRVLLITGGVKSWSVVAALQEAGLEIVGTSVKKSTKEDKERIKELMGQDAHMIDDMTPREMYRMLKDARADIMLSGGRTQFVSLKAKMPWLDINQERHHAYAGYVGMVELVREIDKALHNPVWEQVRQPAPWETQPSEMRTVEPDCDQAMNGQATVVKSKKACTVNPLKMSQPIGGALAFMGVKGCMPVLHGSQGCTSFGLVLFVRHFREAIPLQTTAMSEVATVLGGLENVEQAMRQYRESGQPSIIGICSTGVTEIKGDDVDGFIQLIRNRHPELATSRWSMFRRLISRTPFRMAGPRR